jgi:hypothetical protein
VTPCLQFQLWKKNLMTKLYRLGSTEFVHAPGLVAWAINGAHFRKDRAAMINVIEKTWSIPHIAAFALVTGEVPYTVENDAVVFTA